MTAPNNPHTKGTPMSELAVPEQHAPAAQDPPARSPFAVQSSIAMWAQEADLAYQLATKLAGTSFVPSTMRGKVGDVTACLLAGNELGLKPMAALKSMDVIQGTPALRAHAMRGLIQSHGHEVELLESTANVCRMRGRRKGAEEWQEVVWPIARATQLGLTGKAEWKKQPQTMLVARATGEICRLIASDVLHAVPYTTEEMRDVEPKWTAVQVGAPVTAAEILGRRNSLPEMPQGETLAPQESESSEEEPAEGEPVTIWDELAAAAEALGWDTARAEAEYEQQHNGESIGTASDEDLRVFLGWMREQARSAA